MEIQWIAIAFAFGFLVRRLGQPPLVGYLLAGLVLEAVGFRMDATLQDLSEVGIKLLLFAIGIKLDIGSIARREVWGVAGIHMALTTAILGGVALCLTYFGVPLFDGLDLGTAALIGFALSFSSTVFVVKLLEERDDVSALYGRVAVGVLIVQDVVAVIFLAVSEGKMPSIFAIGLLALFFARPLMHRLLAWSGHGELLVLVGFAFALGGSGLFQLVSMKGDLGALVFGVLAGGHSKSDELAKAIGPFKDIFLVGFFLSVGLSGLPSVEALAIALGLLVFVFFKSAVFHFLFVRFRLRARTGLLSSMSLANYSEFGLIVGAVAVSSGWLDPEWITVFAMSLVFSFVLGSPLNNRVYDIYSRFQAWFHRYEQDERIPEEQPLCVEGARALIFGLGRIGTAVYDELQERYKDAVVGFDIDGKRLDAHDKAGRRVFRASATDSDAFKNLHVDEEQVELVVLAMSSHVENLTAVKLLKESFCKGLIAVTARYDDEGDALRKAGADLVVHVMAEAGAGFAKDALRRVESRGQPPAEVAAV